MDQNLRNKTKEEKAFLKAMMRGAGRRQKLAAAAAFAAAGVLTLSGTALASPAFSRSAEEWARLQDNRLEWDEIGGLIAEYNATVLSNNQNYSRDERKRMDAEEVKNYLLDQADDYEQTAADLDAAGSYVSAAQMRASANSSRESADENVTDKDVIRWGYDQIEDSIVLSAKNLYLSYYRAISEKAAAERQIAYLEKAYQSAQNRQAVGMATQIEVLTAAENLQSARAALVTADAAISSNKKQLMVMCGWKYDADAEIAELPAFDPESIASIDCEADLEKALSSNYTLRMDARRLENAKSGSYASGLVEKHEKQQRDDTNQVKTSLKNAYDALISAKTAYDNAGEQQKLAAESLARSGRQLALGSISAMEYAAAEQSAAAADAAAEQSGIALLAAWVSYEAAVNGLASAGSAS